MTELPFSIVANPALDTWLSIDEQDTVGIRTGKVELGQGILTALTLIAADELGLHPSRIRIEPARTDGSPKEMLTAGSMSVQQSGAALRQACAWARTLLVDQAAELLGADATELELVDGRIGVAGGNLGTTIWELQGGRRFDFDIESLAPERPASGYQWVGHGMPRVDLEDKIRGAGVFVQDLNPPGLCHARVVRPPGPNHRLEAHPSASRFDDPDLLELLVDGSFLAVIAESEYLAARLAERVAVASRWRQLEPLSAPADLAGYLVANETAAFPLAPSPGGGTPEARPVPDSAWPDQDLRHRARYSRPFLMHGSLAPSAAMACLSGEGRLTVWSHSQGIELLRVCLARALRIGVDAVTVIHVPGAGAYGHNGADDVALDAALCARAVAGRPVLVKWTRQQEHGWEPLGPAAHLQLEASLNDAGQITGWSHDVWSFSHMGRPNPARDGLDMLAAGHLAEPFERSSPVPALRTEVGIHRNAWPIYALPQPRVVKRFVAASPLRTSSLRGLGAHANVFAIESFMDELAAAVGQDPVAFRLAHLQDRRARVVLQRVVAMAGGLGGDLPDVGRGVALARYKNQACYAAVLVQARVDPETAQVEVQQVWIAADAGQVVDPDGLINQLEGGAVQSLSWTLKEAVLFDADGVTSDDWESYPILRFSEVPEIATELIDRPDRPFLGAGEATQGPTAAALGNAVFAASSLRMRELPMTPDRVRQVAADP